MRQETLIGNPDYETKSSYNFTVVASDTSQLSSEKAVTLGISDVAEGTVYSIPFGVLAQPVTITSFQAGNLSYKVGSRPSTWCNFGGGLGSSSCGLCGNV